VPDIKYNNKKDKRNERTRYELLKDKDSDLLNLPEVQNAEYIIEYLFEVGPSMSNGMGLCPISYTEIKAWMDATKTECSPWDVNMIRHLSRVFISQHHESEKENCPAPFNYIVENDIENARKQIDSQLRNIFASRKKKVR